MKIHKANITLLGCVGTFIFEEKASNRSGQVSGKNIRKKCPTSCDCKTQNGVLTCLEIPRVIKCDNNLNRGESIYKISD